MLRLGLLCWLMGGCGNKDEEDDSSDTGAPTSATQDGPRSLGDDGSDDAGESGDSGGGSGASTSFTVTISDGTSLDFDLQTCSHYRGSSNFRAFWRKEDRSHVYVLIMEVMGSFDGVGSYSSNDGTVRVKMQQESGGDGTGSSYNTNDVEGGEVVLTIDYLDEDVATGEVTVTSMWNSTEDLPVDVTPTTLPIACEDLAI